jgi:hypothetical protein
MTKVEASENYDNEYKKEFVFVDPIMKIKLPLVLTAQLTSIEESQLRAIGIDFKKMLRENIHREAFYMYTKAYFDSLKRNAKEIDVVLKYDNHIWDDFLRPLIDFTKLAKKPVIYCSAHINNILLEYIGRRTGTNTYPPNQTLQKTDFQFNKKTVTLISDGRLEWSNLETLIYDKNNKRLALKINYSYEHSSEGDSLIDYALETYKSLITLI